MSNEENTDRVETAENRHAHAVALVARMRAERVRQQRVVHEARQGDGLLAWVRETWRAMAHFNMLDDSGGVQ